MPEARVLNSWLAHRVYERELLQTSSKPFEASSKFSRTVYSIQHLPVLDHIYRTRYDLYSEYSKRRQITLTMTGTASVVSAGPLLFGIRD